MTTVALTFDDGPGPWTTSILDVLREHGSRATFFVIGAHIKGNEGTLQRMVYRGHEVGLHGWDHSRLDGLSDDELRGQIRLSKNALARAVPGYRARYWRSPWNHHSEDQALLILDEGLSIIGIDLDGLDTERSRDQIVDTVRDRLRDQIVVALHDGVAQNGQEPGRDRMQTIKALPLILRYCRSVPVSELRDLG